MQSRKLMLTEESANSSANSSVWHGFQPTKSWKISEKYEKCYIFQTKISWQPCQTKELAKELANSLANIGFLD